ncbi:hypothetical protein RSOLAG1IB_00511 [Rhizoctonia solani AG-1 IB]|uniref:Uncharacterized protein n=1 Tax=Thanatephorus cucumeris (strain AG1-IB / isolate 7/3/14) TaxID=1108050 RepID=A0A0B7F4U3_THACB|nr:hypothetical protein RSOLAG1IB_00511 [Rhizoctonia solani AG-1 IB]
MTDSSAFNPYSSVNALRRDSVSTLSIDSTTTLSSENVAGTSSLPRSAERAVNPNSPLRRAPAQLDLFNCIPPHAASQRPRLVYQNSRRDSEDDETTLIYVRTKDNGSKRMHL